MTQMLSLIHSIGTNNLVLALSVIACILSTLALLRSQQKSRSLQQKLCRLEHDLRVANTSAIGMGQQVISLEKKIKQQSHTLAQPIAHQESIAEPPTLNPSHETHVQSSGLEADQSDSLSAYDQARHFLSQGKDVDDVAKQCGLSYAEVSLLQTLGRKQGSTSPS